MKHRRHHNNTGQHTVRSGKTRDQVKAIAAKLGLRYGKEESTDDQSKCGSPGKEDIQSK